MTCEFCFNWDLWAIMIVILFVFTTLICYELLRKIKKSVENEITKEEIK